MLPDSTKAAQLRPVQEQLHSEKKAHLCAGAHLRELHSRTGPTAQKGAKHTQVPREPGVRRVTARGIRANSYTRVWLVPTAPLHKVCPC